MAIESTAQVAHSARGTDTERASIMALVAGCSLETSARDASAVDSYRDHVDPGANVYISHFRGETYHRVILVAAALRRAGFNPVPHLAARNFASFTQARDCVERLTGEAGVDRVLLIAGDLDWPTGPYASSLDLLRAGVLDRHGVRRIGVAGYPEGHGRIGAPELWEALAAKCALARERGMALHVVTQFCFEAAPILSWVAEARSRGIDAPIQVGLAGPASLHTLLKFALRCGIGASVRALGADAASIVHLVTQSGPEPVVRDLANAPARHEIAGLHLFPFGGVVRAADWARAIAAGRFLIRSDRPGFRLG